MEIDAATLGAYEPIAAYPISDVFKAQYVINVVLILGVVQLPRKLFKYDVDLTGNGDI